MLNSALISFSVSFVVLIILLKTRLAGFALDAPNHRSLHTRLTPRTGGLAVMFGVLVAGLFTHVTLSWLIMILAFVSVSLVDDVRGLSVRWRFLVQLVVSGFFVFLYAHQIHFLLWFPVLFGLVWVTNLYNFMDGSDGLAGGMGLFGFSAYAIAFYLTGDFTMAMMCAAIATSCFAFLLFNFYPAKIFMGDSGSIPLGFLAGAIGVVGVVQSHWQAWFPLLVFSPFIVDASITLFKRLLNGERLSQAHRSHYYQRLVQMGWGHQKTAVLEYVLMLLCAASALMMLKLSTITTACLLITWLFVYAVIAILIDKRWKQKSALP